MSPNPPATFRLTIITSKLLLAEAEVEEATLPAIDGEIGILPGHRPLVTALGNGTLTYRIGLSSESYEVSGGTAEILPGRVLVFTEQAEGEEPWAVPRHR
jgi:F-type H+-transporting ATPase subunit epsilon